MWMLDLWVKRPGDAMDVSSFQRLGRWGPAPARLTTVGPFLVRPPLAPVDEESAPLEDGEGGEDESMQEEEGRKTPVQEEREPAFEPGRAGAHEDSHPAPLLVRSLRQRKGEE